jgi:hypothetical protein
LLLIGDADVTTDYQRHDISDMQNTAAAAAVPQIRKSKQTCSAAYLLLAGDADLTNDYQRFDISDAQHTAAPDPQIRKSKPTCSALASCRRC